MFLFSCLMSVSHWMLRPWIKIIFKISPFFQYMLARASSVKQIVGYSSMFSYTILNLRTIPWPFRYYMRANTSPSLHNYWISLWNTEQNIRFEGMGLHILRSLSTHNCILQTLFHYSANYLDSEGSFHVTSCHGSITILNELIKGILRIVRQMFTAFDFWILHRELKKQLFISVLHPVHVVEMGHFILR